MKFTECMRDNGVSAFPDPDASGALTIDGVINGSSLDPSTAAWKQAIGACKDLCSGSKTRYSTLSLSRRPAHTPRAVEGHD